MERRRRSGARIATLVGAVALDLLFFRPAGLPATDPALGFVGIDLSAAMAVQERYAQELLSTDGIAGTAVTMGPNGRPAVMVYLATRSPMSLPATLDGTPLLTEFTGPFYALGDMPFGMGENPAPTDEPLDPKQSFPRPVPIGVSTGQVDVTAGTIGARVTSGGDVFALSNNHVYANKNQAKVGDNILQPGRVDGGTGPSDVIGTLHDFEPIAFCSPFPLCPNNRIDAAIASTTTDNLGNRTPKNGYGTPRSEAARATLGQKVQKYGRTTGHTHGQVTGLNATINVGFRDGTARFVGQIVVTGGGFSAPGDSGSLIVSDGNEKNARHPVGLLFAGSQTSTLANPIGDVLSRFGVSIDGN